MNLDFLLSPESNSGRVRQSSGSRSGRGDPSAFSLDYIAPRNNSESDRSRQHHRRQGEHSSQQRAPAGSSRSPPREQGGDSSKPNFKSKKAKSPASPSSSSQRPPSSTPQRPPPSSPQRPSSSTEGKPHVCPYCQRSFYKLEQLKRHDRLVHQNLRPFVCKTCDLSFGTKQNMQVHLTTRKHRHRLQTLQSSGRSSRAGSSRHH